MAQSRPFLLPVCIDGTPESQAEVPESFAAVHWTRLPDGLPSPAFTERVLRLLSPEHRPAQALAASHGSGGFAPGGEPAVAHTLSFTRRTWLAIGVSVLSLVAVLTWLGTRKAGRTRTTRWPTPDSAALRVSRVWAGRRPSPATGSSWLFWLTARARAMSG